MNKVVVVKDSVDRHALCVAPGVSWLTKPTFCCC